ncbi:response regulator [Robertmurraya massiliosenegalensis]|uniref:response regulator transcription factor n=1 Tax=Robertmurraya TaxID=2837507 RepID=UPI0039A581BE
MIKVVIADDEEKVCQLIMNLVNWEPLDMQVVGVAHNGIEALNKVTECKPDLIITDIRMPGCDGLELIRLAKKVKEDLDFIVISGYRHFEYAQNAIKYGVGDYLLKPIKKDELTTALGKMKNRFLSRTEQLDNVERLRNRLKSDSDKLRNNFFTEILLNKNTVVHDLTINQMNDTYHFSFREGLFQVFMVKIDCSLDDQYKQAIEILEEKTIQIINNRLKDYCIDLWAYGSDSYLYCVLNYEPSLKKTIRMQLKIVLDELITQEAAFAQFRFTVGAGSALEDINRLQDTYKEARLGIMQRLVLGPGKLIEDIIPTKTSQKANKLLAELNKPMGVAIEVLDKDSLLNWIENLKVQVKSYEELQGETIFSIVEQVWEMYLLHLRNHQLNIHLDEKFNDTLPTQANHCSTIEQLFHYLTKLISESLEKIIEDKKQEETKPIRIAKQYIQENYMNTISLENISNLVGFNPSYFSTLFKKVSGSNFVDYHAEIRINKAKELLRETNSSIALICNQVGYQDIKHFTKIFKKKTGLKPNEFRKLYS